MVRFARIEVRQREVGETPAILVAARDRLAHRQPIDERRRRDARLASDDPERQHTESDDPASRSDRPGHIGMMAHRSSYQNRSMHPRDATALQASQRLPRQIAVVDGRRLAYVRLGEGTPPIVFLAGAGMDIDSWFKVLPGVADFGTVVAVDRLGVGKSDRPTVPQTAGIIVAALRSLLAQSGVAPPYVLVGHSLGGLHVELFARLHPGEVAGVVLVEAASPEEAMDPPRPGFTARAIGAVAGAFDRLRGRPRGLDEVDHVDETVRQIRAASPFPDIPLVVVTGGKRLRMVPEAAFAAHQDAQRGRAVLAPRGRQIVAEASGHFPQLHDPDVVIAAIRDVAGLARG
jgi:pimeloyl-ACP methyl ester carboxylesterase